MGCKQQTNLQKAEDFYSSRDFKDALLYYEKACLDGEVYACKMTALMHQEGKHSIPISKAKAFKALEFACKYGDLNSCKIVYKAYTILKLKDMAQRVLEYSCQGGEASSCLKLAKNAFTPKDYKPSLELATKACYGGESKGCQLAIAIIQRFDPKSLNLRGLEKQLKLLLQS